MVIADSGNLILHPIDLKGWELNISDSEVKLVNEERCKDMKSFTVEAQIAAAYAFMAGYKVKFRAMNKDFTVKLACDVNPGVYCWPKKEWRKW